MSILAALLGQPWRNRLVRKFPFTGKYKHRATCTKNTSTKNPWWYTNIGYTSFFLGVLQFRLKIEKLSGNPVNWHCECPAGKGSNATCKHIAAVLLMLESFSQTGEIHVKNFCAQDLQTFHKPRSHYNGKKSCDY